MIIIVSYGVKSVLSDEAWFYKTLASKYAYADIPMLINEDILTYSFYDKGLCVYESRIDMIIGEIILEVGDTIYDQYR